MNNLRAFGILCELLSTRWLARETLDKRRERKLRRLVQHAYQFVPYYRELFDGAGVKPDDIRTLEDLPRIPLSTKKRLQAAGADAITSSAFRPEGIRTSKTSGSSGRPFTIRQETRWGAVRKAMFLRALMSCGYHPGKKAMFLRSRDGRPAAWWKRSRYANYNVPEEQLLRELDDFRPWLLYGWVTPLRQLARYIQENGLKVWSPGAIVSTAETLDGPTRRLIENAFHTRVFEIYGLTEMGSLAWECVAHNGYHVAEDTAVIESVPGDSGGPPRLVMTNLELLAMPFIRYDAGDLGAFADSLPCECGLHLRRLDRVEGRVVDCVRLTDGRVISPYEFTVELEKILALDRYQVIQNTVDRLTVRIEGRSVGEADKERVRQMIRSIAGDDVTVSISHESSLDPEPGQWRKFRVVECRLPDAVRS